MAFAGLRRAQYVMFFFCVRQTPLKWCPVFRVATSTRARTGSSLGHRMRRRSRWGWGCGCVCRCSCSGSGSGSCKWQKQRPWQNNAPCGSGYFWNPAAAEKVKVASTRNVKAVAALEALIRPRPPFKACIWNAQSRGRRQQIIDNHSRNDCKFPCSWVFG